MEEAQAGIKIARRNINNLRYADAAAAKSLQSCPTLCDPIDGSPPGSLSLGFSRQEHSQSGPSLLCFHLLFVKDFLARLHRGLLTTSGLALPDLSGFLLKQAL